MLGFTPLSDVAISSIEKTAYVWSNINDAQTADWRPLDYTVVVPFGTPISAAAFSTIESIGIQTFVGWAPVDDVQQTVWQKIAA